MSIGNVTLIIATVALAGSVLAYLRASRSGKSEPLARLFFSAHVVLLTVALINLLVLLLKDQFQYSYVASYSSSTLELFYKISAVWAGQEGTFLLWAWVTGIIGLFMMRGHRTLAPHAMLYMGLVQMFLMVLMFVRSPFAMLPPADVMADGKGLNPLLKDPWMVIHPPIVFVGYAAFTAPFCLALAALAKRAWKVFADVALPWTAFAIATLGAGIFIGGFWAYKVLGWGGYWGWDPVENASLIPWLLGLALIHGLIVMRHSGRLIKTTLTLALLSYILVAYGTFLTRSGVLADFSVHAFTDLGLNIYLIAFLAFVVGISILRLLLGTRGLKTDAIAPVLTSREFGIALGVIVLTGAAALVWVGTSAPILTSLFGQPANVTPDYYNIIILPIGIFLALTLGFSPFLHAERTPWDQLSRAILPSLAAAIVISAIVRIVYPIQNLHLAIVFLSVFAAGSNLLAIVRFSHGRVLHMSGHLTHLGFGIMVIGIIGSSAYATREMIQVPAGAQAQAYGYDIAFNGAVTKEQAEDGYLDLTISRNGQTSSARPRLYISDYSQQEMRTPHVMRSALFDLYLSPMEYRLTRPSNVLHLTKNRPFNYRGWDLTFTSFNMGSHDGSSAMRVGTVIQAEKDGASHEITPAMVADVGGTQHVEQEIPGTDLIVKLIGMSVEQGLIEVEINDRQRPVQAQPGGMLTLEVSKKPLTSFVWFGTIVMTLGSGLSIWRRVKKIPAKANTYRTLTDLKKGPTTADYIKQDMTYQSVSSK